MPPAGEDGDPDDPDERDGNPDEHDETGGGDRESIDGNEGAGATDDEGGATDGTGENAPLGVTGTDVGEPFVMSEAEGEKKEEDEGPVSEEENEGPLEASEGIGPPDGPPGGQYTPGPPGSDDGEDEASGLIGWILRGDGTGATFLREFVGSALVVVLIGLLLFAISGVWPPMVAVESGSMEPQMERGDLVFVMDQNRFKPDASVMDTGIATYRSSLETGYGKFGNPGDVIIYRQDGSRRSTPIIHRARFWVNGSENWYDKANESFINGNDCESIRNCPAPHDGFITKGDNNEQYDQVSGISGPVKPGWIKGTAELRIPWLGHVRLELSELTVSSSALTLSSLPPDAFLVTARGLPVTGVAVSPSPERASS